MGKSVCMDCMDCLLQDVCIWTCFCKLQVVLSPGVVSTEEVPTVYAVIWFMVYGLFVVCVCLLVYMQSVMR